jgi:hypothetical protein
MFVLRNFILAELKFLEVEYIVDLQRRRIHHLHKAFEINLTDSSKHEGFFFRAFGILLFRLRSKNRSECIGNREVILW